MSQTPTEASEAPAADRAPARVRPPVVVLVVAFLAAVVAVYLRLRVFPDGSLNNDEGVYLRQAMALRDGHLRVPLADNPGAGQPWLFTISPDGYVSKYLPVVSGLYALGLLLFGSVTAVLALLAAAVPLLVFRLGRLTGLCERRATVAAALVGLSPAVLVQGGVLLSYLPFLVLTLGAWTAAFSAATSLAQRWSAAAALLSALAVCARPLDGLLMTGPVLLWLLWRSGDAKRTVGALLAGGVPVLVAVLAYNEAVTGSALQMPFSLLEPLDKLGFGVRKLYPEDIPHSFGLAESRLGTWRHFFREPSVWFWGFPVLLVLAAWAARPRGPATERQRLLLGCAGLLLVTYVGFWGPWNASVAWGGTQTVGPFYSLSLLTPMALAALATPVPASVPGRALVGVAALLSLVPPAVHVPGALADAREDKATTRAVTALVSPELTTLVDVDPPYLGHPVSALGAEAARADVRLAGRVPASEVPASGARLLQLVGYPYLDLPGAASALSEVRREAGATLPLSASRVGGKSDELLVVSHAGRTTACAAAAGVQLVLAASGPVTGCDSVPVPPGDWDQPYRLCADEDCLSLTYLAQSGSGDWYVVGWRRMALEHGAGTVTALTDGPVIRSSGVGWVRVTTG